MQHNRPSSRKAVVFVVNGQHVHLPSVTVVVGRISGIGDDQPDIDLNPYGAQEKGVSRRHVRVIFDGARVYVCDLSSTNGTWLNSQRLQPAEKYPLHTGDMLWLGKLRVEVRFWGLHLDDDDDSQLRGSAPSARHSGYR